MAVVDALVGDDAVGGTPLPNCPYDDTALGACESVCQVTELHAMRHEVVWVLDGLTFLARRVRLAGLCGCPRSSSAAPGGVLFHPTVVFTYALIVCVCAVIAVLTMLRYNSVVVFNRKIRTPSISNTPWVVYYSLAGSRYAAPRLQCACALVLSPLSVLHVPRVDIFLRGCTWAAVRRPVPSAALCGTAQTL